jgi:multidrug efflux pump
MFSLVLTLYVIPAVYTYLSRKKKKSEMELMDEKEEHRA